MSEPVRLSPHDPRAAGVGDPGGREFSHEDPLEELARILGEGVAHPVRPENVVDVGRRSNPGRPMPQQLSELEAALFEELRSSVTPQERVRGNFTREVTPAIPQHPVDDHDIASLGAFTAEDGLIPGMGAAPAGPGATASGATELSLSDYYAYDDAYGEAIGSADPHAQAHYGELDAAFAAEAAGRSAQALRPTFADFDPQSIAMAARETEPYMAQDAAFMPHSAEELDAATRLPREHGRTGLGIAVALVGVVLLGGGGWAAWKTWGDLVPGGGPVLVRADGKPLKALPDPTKAPPADAEPTLVRDTAVNGSKIVSRQEDPVDQVSGRTPEGREVRVINPGAQRPASSDVPHAVKTVVVRPDGSIVTDGDKPRPTVAPSVPSVPTPPAAAMPQTPPQAPAPIPPPAEPQASTPIPSVSVKTTTVTAVPVPPTPAPVVAAVPPVAVPAPPVAAQPQPVPVRVPLPVAAPPPPVAAQPAPQAAVPPATVKTVTTTPVTPPAAPPPAAPQVKTVTTTTITPPSAGAPLSLGPVAPKLASAPPPAAPVAAAKPTPTAPVAAPKPTPVAAAPVALAPPPAAAAASGEWAVQISASKSDADARKSFADAQHRYGALAGRSLDVQRADLGDKGTFYRARVPAGTRDQAAALCGQIQAQGGQCMVVKR